MDQRTRKLMTMHRTLNFRDDVSRLYVSRKEGGRGLTTNEYSVDASIQQLEDYLEKHGERLITATGDNNNNTRINITKLTRTEKWEEKQLYGFLKRQVSEISYEKTRTWLRKGKLTRETESILTEALNNAIRTNYIETKIYKIQQNTKCRSCCDRYKTINHIISECSKLTQKDYKTRRNWVVKAIHWELCKKFKSEHTNKWYIHNIESLLENETYRLLRDFKIQTDYLISATQPDLIIVNKKENLPNCWLCFPGWPQSKIEINRKEG